ncbi:Alpha-xylosidase [compost metagenome]
MALLNCWQIPNPPWLQVDGEKNKAGEFMEDYKWVQETCRELFELRMSLVPYLYTAFARYLKEGVPPFRALVMDYPDDEHTYNIDDAYMMGDSILVAPLVTGAREREVYLPRGDWRDFWTHERYKGGRAYTFSPELKRLPVFVKDNTLLPLAKPLQYIADDSEFELTVRVYGSSPADFLLYEDDGFSLQHREGHYNWIHLSYGKEGKGNAERRGNFAGSKYTITSFERLG